MKFDSAALFSAEVFLDGVRAGGAGFESAVTISPFFDRFPGSQDEMTGKIVRASIFRPKIFSGDDAFCDDTFFDDNFPGVQRLGMDRAPIAIIIF
ncbi:MAG: hypothetical protein NTV34_12005 [Proteobacteria bacterium]|nr:hypothetical protein [Pseudomonadota bacterium]